MALRTSPMGMTPSFSPSMGSENSANASLISASSRAVMLCSLASLDWRSLGAEGGVLRLGGWGDKEEKVVLVHLHPGPAAS